MSGQHSEGPARATAGGPDDGASFDWWKILDIAVWVSVGVIVVMGVEWLVGKVIRESMSSGASRYLAKVNSGEVPES